MKIYVRQEDVRAAIEAPQIYSDPIEAALVRRGFRASIGYTTAIINGKYYRNPPKAVAYIKKFIATRNALPFSYELRVRIPV